MESMSTGAPRYQVWRLILASAKWSAPRVHLKKQITVRIDQQS